MITSIFTGVVLLLKVVWAVITYLERQGAIDEGKKQILAQELAAVAAAAKIAQTEQSNVDGMSDAQVDTSLHDDFRP